MLVLQTQVTFQGSPYITYTLQLLTQVTLSKSRPDAIAMPMICFLIRHGFLLVFSIVMKIMLYSIHGYVFYCGISRSDMSIISLKIF